MIFMAVHTLGRTAPSCGGWHRAGVSLLGLCHAACRRLDIDLRHWGATDGSLGRVWYTDIRGLELPRKIQDTQLNLNFW